MPTEPYRAAWTVQSPESVERGGDEVVLYLFFGSQQQYEQLKGSRDEQGRPKPGSRPP